METKPYIVSGGVFNDDRGDLFHVNDFIMDDVRRFYIIHQDDMSVVRAWHAHKHERKYFYVAQGAFLLAFVKIDNWPNPSPSLQAEKFLLSEKESNVICVPEGYANGVKALEPNSKLVVFSNKTLADAADDSWRYDKNLWVDWGV